MKKQKPRKTTLPHSEGALVQLITAKTRRIRLNIESIKEALGNKVSSLQSLEMLVNGRAAALEALAAKDPASAERLAQTLKNGGTL